MKDVLARVPGVFGRAMFGGWGIYQGERFFGIVFNGRLFFKVSEETKSAYRERGAEPFSPSPRQTLHSFYEVPPEVLDSPVAAAEWARDALKAASSLKKAGRGRPGR
ncbi:MAG: TfoX/Sxy family protein [Elusimicrobia bacterium]|nr:TfoX/Sxy family protein [Elusimicrobiota bacterium]